MITVISRDCKDISQESYDSMVFSLPIHHLTCSCGRSGSLCFHGRYTRRVITQSLSFRLSVCRLKCSECGRTHAILPASIVPYVSLILSIQIEILRNAEEPSRPSAASVCKSALFFDEDLVRSVIRRYRRFWRERLRSVRVSLEDIPFLIRSCFLNYSLQFMQIHRNTNILFSSPT